MLWVQVPPGPLSRPRGALECSPPCHGGDHGFESHRGRLPARYANRQSGQAQTLVNVCGFDSHPCYLVICVGRALASLSGCKPPASSSAGSTTARRTDGPFVYWFEDTGPSSRKDGFDSHTGYLAKWCNGRHTTLRTSRRKGMGVRLSPWSLRSALEPGCQRGLISRPTPVRIRPPQLERPSTQIGKAARSRAW